MLEILEDRGVNQVSKSRNPWSEEAQNHQDDCAEKENPTMQEKANHVTKQVETPQIRDTGESVH